jgi:hypothetical protein
MAKKKTSVPKVTVGAIAKAELVAKATYQRKHLVTEEIPPDVTRAKAGAWLNLISPITEWAGLKGDALKFQRRLLRIQQEETLLRVAHSVREKMIGVTISQPVPRKILVPALEKASLEESDDSVMIDRWASLLASAAQKVKVQPRFVGILDEMTGKQAECLERIAFNRYEDFYFPRTIFSDSFLEFAEHHMGELFRSEMLKVLTREGEIDAAFEKIFDAFNRPGVSLEVALISDNQGDMWDSSDGRGDHSDTSILESLGLIRFVVLKTEIALKRKKTKFEVSVYYHHLTKLGVEFCEVCSRARLGELEAINAASAKSRLQRQDIF